MNPVGDGGRLLRGWRRFCEFQAELTELSERMFLLQRPWEEDWLHWSFDGRSWHLHGHLQPPARGRHSVTRSGWCPAREP